MASSSMIPSVTLTVLGMLPCGPIVAPSWALAQAAASSALLLLCAAHSVLQRSKGAATAATSFPPKGSSPEDFIWPPNFLPSPAVPRAT